MYSEIGPDEAMDIARPVCGGDVVVAGEMGGYIVLRPNPVEEDGGGVHIRGRRLRMEPHRDGGHAQVSPPLP